MNLHPPRAGHGKLVMPMGRSFPLGVTVLLMLAGCGRDPLLHGGERDAGPNVEPPDGSIPGFDAGRPDAAIQCFSPFDCQQRFGSPPLCPRGPSEWRCVTRQCRVQCLPGSNCISDCECSLGRVCRLGQCVPTTERNRCCSNPDCPPRSTCVLPNGALDICEPADAGVPDAGRPDSGQRAPVGGACSGPQDCEGGLCLGTNGGFPGGYCSQACGGAGLCPTGSDCRELETGQRVCLDSCVDNVECRSGYRCVQLGATPGRVCWPVEPGSNNPLGAPVGSFCEVDNDCEEGTQCLTAFPDGYCTIVFCDVLTYPCPSGSSCFAVPSSVSLCLADCPSGGSPSTCRDGYFCFGQNGEPGACVPN